MSKPISKQSQLAGNVAPIQPVVDPNQVANAANNVDQADTNLANATEQYVRALTEIGNSVAQSASIAGTQINNAISQAVPSDLSKLQITVQNAQSTIATTLTELQTVIDGVATKNQALMQQMQQMQQAPTTQASAKAFNLKKYSQFLNDQQNMENPRPSPNINPQSGFGPFSTSAELANALRELGKQEELGGIGRSEVENKIINYIENEGDKEKVRKTIKGFFEYDLDPNTQNEYINEIWDLLPSVLKTQDSDSITGVERKINNQENTMANIEDIKKIVEASNEEIRKKAQGNKPKKQSYNFKKEAQHKTYENVILWGPESRRIDPFTGEPVSDWHIFERNRGWGFRIGDRWDIDFEAFWRGNIMDKYHRPYRDEDGNWVGGYIEKRFEVDRWQPDENKYMLKPDERRKPRPAELGNMEARLEAYRGNKDAVYNWAEASGKKRIKTAAGPFDYDEDKAEWEAEQYKENQMMREDEEAKEIADEIYSYNRQAIHNTDYIPGSGGPEAKVKFMNDIAPLIKKELQEKHYIEDTRKLNRMTQMVSRELFDKVDNYESEELNYDGTTTQERYNKDWEQKFGPGGTHASGTKKLKTAKKKR